MRPSLIGGQGHGAMWRLWQLTPAPPPPQNGAQGCSGCWWGRRGHNETRALPTPPPVEALEEMGKDQGDAETKGKEATSAAKKIKKKNRCFAPTKKNVPDFGVHPLKFTGVCKKQNNNSSLNQASGVSKRRNT